jgi:hypothetical protein
VRPGIESWHKILKSGCSVTDCRLSEAERLKPYLALMGVVAWRLFWLTHINRQTPSGRVPPFWLSTNGKRSLPPSIAHRPLDFISVCSILLLHTQRRISNGSFILF